MGVTQFRDFFAHTVTLEAWTGQDAYGKATYGAAVTYPARVEMKSRLIAGSAGTQLAARGRVFLGTATVPNDKDRLTLPASFVPTQPPILDVYPETDETGIHHIVLYIG